MNWWRAHHGLPFDPRLAAIAWRTGVSRREEGAVWQSVSTTQDSVTGAAYWAFWERKRRNASNARNASEMQVTPRREEIGGDERIFVISPNAASLLRSPPRAHRRTPWQSRRS